MSEKPKWWPENPYHKSVFVMERGEYAKIVPDEKTRTGLSGMLGREFWDTASDVIWEEVDQQISTLQERDEEWKQIDIANSIAIADFKEKLRWIPVSERLPEVEDHEAALGNSKAIQCFYGDMSHRERCEHGIPFGIDVDIYNVEQGIWMSGMIPTHWRLLDLPTGEQESK